MSRYSPTLQFTGVRQAIRDALKHSRLVGVILSLQWNQRTIDKARDEIAKGLVLRDQLMGDLGLRFTEVPPDIPESLLPKPTSLATAVEARRIR